MKKTHQIGLMTVLFASVALTPFAQDQVQSSSTPASSDAVFRLSVGPGFGLPIGNFSGDDYWQQTHSFRTGGSDLNTLGVEVAYSFGL
jgi:hypothetical protein